MSRRRRLILSNSILPTSLAGLQLWLDADDDQTVKETANSVSQWNDKSGNGNDVTQGTGSAQPTTNVSTLNSKNVIDFDGNDTLVLPSALFTIPNGANTIFVVCKRNTETGSSEKIIGLSEAGSQRLLLDYGSVADAAFYQSRSASGDGATQSGTNTSFTTFSCFRDGTTQSISRNGATASTNASGADEPGIDAGHIGSLAGSSAFLIGSVAEVIIYDRALSATEITSVENYLSAKWFSIPFNSVNLVKWVDADNPNTIVESANLVSSWDDRSRFSGAMTQATGTDQPLIIDDELNNKNVIRFDGTNDSLLGSGVGITGSNSGTVFVVAKPSSSTQDEVAWYLGDDGGLDRKTIQADVNTNAAQAGYRFNGGNNLFSSPFDGTFQVGTWIWPNGATLSDFDLYVDSVLQTSISGGPLSLDLIDDEFMVGAGRNNSGGLIRNFDGDIAELIVYDKELSATERLDVETYLTEKWLNFITPTDLAGLQLWLDADDSDSIKQTSNSVFRWEDKSGNNNNVPQGTGSAQPTTNVSTQNGKNVIDFDGGDTLIVPSALFSIPTGDNTIFVVSKRTSETAAIESLFNLRESTNNRYFIIYSSVSGQIDFRNGTTSVGKGSLTNTNFQILRGRRNGTTEAVTANRASETTSTNAVDEAGIDAGFIGGLTGSSSRLIGSIAEIILYNRSLTTEEIGFVESYLTNKWGL